MPNYKMTPGSREVDTPTNFRDDSPLMQLDKHKRGYTVTESRARATKNKEFITKSGEKTGDPSKSKYADRRAANAAARRKKLGIKS